MIRMIRVIALVCALLPLSAGAKELPGSFADLVEKLSPAVVNISTTQKIKTPGGMKFKFQGLPEGQQFDPFREFFERFGDMQGEEGGAERSVTSLGSGFVIDSDGYIVTNYHVVNQAEQITVRFQDDTKYEAKVLGRDAKTDLALIKIEANRKLPFVPFGDSDKMRVGDWVIAIGNPFGLGGSVTAGIVSARSRNINSGPFDDFIQTDAAINRGNSGGPLFNTQGEVIGVNSAIFSPTGGNIGIGFSIPSALAKPVLTQLRQFGRTHRGWLGVKIQHITDELANSLGLEKPRGALVLEVSKDSPAEKAGVQSGDVILKYNDTEISEMRGLPRMVAETKAGTKATLTLLRKGKEKALTITLAEMEEADGKESKSGKADEPSDEKPQGDEVMGLRLSGINTSLRKQFDIDASVDGVLVLAIDPKTAPTDLTLVRGDVIMEANQEKISSAADFKSAIERARKDKKTHALLRVMRGSTPLFLTIPTEKKADKKD